MRSIKRTGMVVLAVAALSVPTAASALSIGGSLQKLLLGWSQHLKDQHQERDWNRGPRRWNHGPSTPRDTTPPEQSVPEPTAALLFGLGAAVVAARTRKRS